MSVNITLYNFSKRENSTARPSGSGVTVSALLKLPTDIVNPSFQLSGVGADYNYIEWDGRYYYRNTARYETNTVVTYECSLDVLATYRSQIMNTSAFVKYSASDFNVYIDDDRMSIEISETDGYTQNAELLTDGTDEDMAGTFILEYATDEATYGPTGCVYLDAETCAQVTGMLNSEGFNDFLNSAAKQLQGAYDCLVGCRYVPFTWYSSGSLSRIALGGYVTDINAIRARSIHWYYANVNIPWQYDDFRRSAKYCALLLYLPGYGWFELNPNDFAKHDQIAIKLAIDGITGNGTYLIGGQARADCCFATNIGIGTLSSNAVGMIGTIGSAASLIALGASGAGLLATAAAGASFLTGAIGTTGRNVGTTGTSSGTAGVLQSPNDFKRVYCIVVQRRTNVDPSSLASTIGRPLCEVRQLGSLSGYVQTVDASVSVPADDTIADRINSYLNGGVYLE